MYHVLDTPSWLGPTGFYDDDLRSLLERNESKTWEPVCAWATPAYGPEEMYVTFAPSASYPPPSDREYLLELLSVPEEVTGAPDVGTVWVLSLEEPLTLTLPTYRTEDGLTGYQFSFTITEAAPPPGDSDNDGDVDLADYVVFERCFTGPAGEPGPDCTPEDLACADINEDDHVDLADYLVLAEGFTGVLPGPPTYTGTAGCTECHDVEHSDWMATRHASAFQTLIDDEEEGNPACFPCHTLGFGEPSGFVDIDTTPELANVQCESCHGPGSHHADDAENVGIEVDLDSAMCGRCHQSCHGKCGDYYHPHYEQWSVSMHSQALADIVLLPEYEQSCLLCHSTDYRLAPEDDKPGPEEVRFSLECVACHAPRGSAYDHQLRLPPAELCAQCHTTEGALPGEEVDHGQFEFMNGEGGFDLDGNSLDGLYPPFFECLLIGCESCHVYRHLYGGPDDPSDSGHDFVFDARACSACHTEEVATQKVALLRAEIEPRLAAIAPYFDAHEPEYVDPGTLSPEELERYLIAKFDYEFVIADMSFGLHNANFTRRLLDEVYLFFGIEP